MRATIPIATALCLAACTPEDVDDTVPEIVEPSVVLASTLTFGQAVDGVSEGFDLDGATTGIGDSSGCGVPDYVGIDGEAGVDNTFANLLPVIELLGGRALYGLIQEAVDNGELLIMIEAEGWEDATPGQCIPVNVLRGLGEPVIGGHGSILEGQTFDRNADFPSSEVPCGTVREDGALLIDGFAFRMPLRVLDETVDLTLNNAMGIVRPTEDGFFAGSLSGGIDAAELAANVTGFDAIPEALIEGIVGALDSRADLAPDASGTCTQLSVVVTFGGVSAYLFDDEAI